MESDDRLYEAVRAYTSGRLEAAGSAVDRAASAAPDSLVARELATYLHRLAQGDEPRETGVYHREPEAFRRFIRGGGNVGLYRALAGSLSEIYGSCRPSTILDIGPGDGRVVLDAWGPAAGPVELVEPAAALLEAAIETLTRSGVPHRPVASSIEEFLDTTSHSWALAQATFSLQSLSPPSRAVVLGELHRRCARLVVVEFDVPRRRHPFDPSWFGRCLERMERGLAEYGDDREMVAQGFLLPMMMGFFTHSERTNHEQPIAAWADELRAVGFEVTPPRLLYDYWWASAYLLDATSVQRTAAGSG